MCGIIGAVSTQDVAPLLLDGLKRMAYRGYDSSGLAVLNSQSGNLERVRAQGKVGQLEAALTATPVSGCVGIAHTRWATHGVPSERNAHPIVSCDEVAVVHNGILENHEQLRSELLALGYAFSSDTDTEVAAHLIHHYTQDYALLTAVRLAVERMVGAFALAIISKREPDRVIGINRGAPLVVGFGDRGLGHYLASDNLALLPVTRRFTYLEEGDLVELTLDHVHIEDAGGHVANRPVQVSDLDRLAVERGTYRHYMQKEIFEQPVAAERVLEGRTGEYAFLESVFGVDASCWLNRIDRVQIAACGTSYHAGMVGRYWLESFAHLPCQVEIASELRYRSAVVSPNTLFVVLSQSGETADTLAALRQAKSLGYAHTLAICNVPESSIVREADSVFLIRAGTEICVASTKSFTNQLIAMALLVLALGSTHGMSCERQADLRAQLREIPNGIRMALSLDEQVRSLAVRFVHTQHVLFLGRGLQYPVALEGALKLKELSYIHAEAYPAGELKHGPLALVDHHMPVIAVAPNNELLEKLKSNLREVQARGGRLIVFGDAQAPFQELPETTLIRMPAVSELAAPIVYNIPLQLLAYHVAVLKGTDVDQPRNLAKSVTVE